jgi:hypothetical protein
MVRTLVLKNVVGLAICSIAEYGACAKLFSEHRKRVQHSSAHIAYIIRVILGFEIHVRD